MKIFIAKIEKNQIMNDLSCIYLSLTFEEYLKWEHALKISKDTETKKFRPNGHRAWKLTDRFTLLRNSIH